MMLQTAFLPGARCGVRTGSTVLSCSACRGIGYRHVGARYDECEVCDRRGVLTFRGLAKLVGVDRSTLVRLARRGETSCRAKTAAALLEGLAKAGLAT